MSVVTVPFDIILSNAITACVNSFLDCRVPRLEKHYRITSRTTLRKHYRISLLCIV